MIALAAALCVAIGPLEALIPDAHDGDAPSTVVYADGAHEAGMTTGIESATQYSEAVQVAAPASSEGQHSAPAHRVHVDHCSHSHLVAVCDPAPPMTPGLIHGPRVIPPDLKLASVARAPGLRPPIA